MRRLRWETSSYGPGPDGITVCRFVYRSVLLLLIEQFLQFIKSGIPGPGTHANQGWRVAKSEGMTDKTHRISSRNCRDPISIPTRDPVRCDVVEALQTVTVNAGVETTGRVYALQKQVFKQQ